MPKQEEECERLPAKKTTSFQHNDDVPVSVNAAKPRVLLQSPSVGTSLIEYLDPWKKGSPKAKSAGSPAMVDEAWKRLKKSYVYFKGKPVGTLAAMDPTAETLNYNKVYQMFLVNNLIVS